jgi:hypothetical protein
MRITAFAMCALVVAVSACGCGSSAASPTPTPSPSTPPVTNGVLTLEWARVDESGGLRPIVETGSSNRTATIRTSDRMYAYARRLTSAGNEIYFTTQARWSVSDSSVLLLETIRVIDLNNTGAFLAWLPLGGLRIGQSRLTVTEGGESASITVNVIAR